MLQRGKWPYQLATNGELKRILQEARVRFSVDLTSMYCHLNAYPSCMCMSVLQFAILYAAGTVAPKAIKLCVIGAAGAGKTTLLEALKRGRFKFTFTWERKRDDPRCELERTVGVNVMTVDIPGVGRFVLYDYAGQKQFHKAHGLFFSTVNSFFILLISLLTGEERRLCTFEELIHVAQYWLSFLRASLGGEFIHTHSDDSCQSSRSLSRWSGPVATSCQSFA